MLALTCGAAVFAGERQESYNGTVTLLLLAPSDAHANVLADTSASLVATTGVVVRATNGPHDRPATVSADLTLTSIGTAEGWIVNQPSAGSQWERSFDTSEIDVRSSGPTLPAAQAQMRDALDRVRAELTRLEVAQGVDPAARIRTDLSPQEPVFTTQSGSRIRSMGVVALLGVIAACSAAIAADAAAARRRRAAVSP